MLLFWFLIVMICLCMGWQKICDNANQCDNDVVYCPDNDACYIICSAPSACTNVEVYCSGGLLCQAQCSGLNNSCQGITIHCNNAECNIYCIGMSGCAGAIIYGSNSNAFNVYCRNENACESSQIQCNTESSCGIICDGIDACTNSKIYGSMDKQLNIQCSSDYACQNINVNASDSSRFEMTDCAQGNYTCRGITVSCPPNVAGDPQCVLNGDGDGLFGDSHNALTFYAINGFQDIQFVTGSKTSNFYGTMYCKSDYSSSCSISTTGWICDSSGDTTCDDPPQPTSSPTTNPTQTPTYNPSFSPITSIATNNSTLSAVHIQYIILSFIMVISITYILIKSCLKLCIYKREKDLKIKMIVKIMTISQMVSFLFCYLFWIISILLNHEIVFNVLQYLMFIMGWILFYLFMVHRLYHTFKDSVYRMTKKHIYFHAFITAFIPIWYLTVSILNEIDGDSISMKIYLFISAFGFIIIFMGLLLLIVSFNRNLFHCYIVEQTDMELSDVQISVLTIIAKQTLLGSIILSVELCFVVTICLLTFLKQKKHDLSWVIYEWFLGFLIIINLLCIYLGFKVNANVYDRLCGRLHSKLLHCYECIAYRHMNDDFAQMNDDLDL